MVKLVSKEKRNEYNRRYYQKNIEKRRKYYREYQRKYRKNHPEYKTEYKDIEERKKYLKDYYIKNKKKINEYCHKWYLKNKKRKRKKNKLWYKENKETHKEIVATWKKNNPVKVRKSLYKHYKKVKLIKKEIYELLGNKCKKCEYTGIALQIDHVKNDGFKERKRFKGRNKYLNHILNKIKKNSNDYQLLCANCNFEKALKLRRNELI